MSKFENAVAKAYEKQWRRLHRTSAYELVYDMERYEVYEKGPRFE